MSALDRVARARPGLAERLAARALALAVDPAISVPNAVDSLVTLAQGDPPALEQALHRVLAPGPDRTNALSVVAADTLRLAIDRFDDRARGVGDEQVHR